MGLYKRYHQIIVLLLTVCILNSCTSYKNVVLDEDQSFDLEGDPIIIYGLDTELIINNVEILNNQLNGSVMSEKPSKRGPRIKMRIYLKETFTSPEATDGKVVVPLDEIEKVEVKNYGTS